MIAPFLPFLIAVVIFYGLLYVASLLIPVPAKALQVANIVGGIVFFIWLLKILATFI